mgnify:CR=1 FL=1
MLKTKYLRMALAEFGDRSELLDNAYKELYKLEEYVREHEGLSKKHWTLCDRPQRNELREIAAKLGFKFNDDPSWDFAWVRLGTNGTSFFFDFEFTETPDNGPQVVAVALHGPQPAVGGSAFGISSH